MPELLHFPALPNRPIRPVSFEQETTGDTYTVADALGVPRRDYHGGARGRADRVYVEADGSCGAEVIYSMLPLGTENGAARARDYWQAVRDTGARVNYHCGFHVHVDPRPCDFSSLASLYHLWNGVEDVLYRLGGAGYARGHRGTHYCDTIPKGYVLDKDVGAIMQRGRGGLNLANVTRAMFECRCGAMRFGVFSECTCDLSMPTVEFRVWNGTRNLRKGHAYIALSLGMVAEAQRIRYDRKRCGILEWQGEGNHPAAGREMKALERVLNLPMSPFDREQVLYTVRRSSIPAVIGAGNMATIETRYGTGGTPAPVAVPARGIGSYEIDDDDETESEDN